MERLVAKAQAALNDISRERSKTVATAQEKQREAERVLAGLQSERQSKLIRCDELERDVADMRQAITLEQARIARYVLMVTRI
jgi:hypothetical protein